jgi:uncharacterized membrane protein
MWILRAVMMLALIVWIGGIMFFAFVLAPTLFTVLPSPQMAGTVVSPTLTKLHNLGLISGLVFLICSVVYNWRRYAQLRLMSTTHILLIVMLVLTAISQFVVTPRMRELRTSPNGLETSSARQEFDSLHIWSTRLEGGVLLLGLGVVALTARRFGNPGS